MSQIEIIVPATARVWQQRLADRLASAGHNVAISHSDALVWPLSARLVLALERSFRRGSELTQTVTLAPRPATGPVDLRIDLTGNASSSPIPTLQPAFDGHRDAVSALTTLATGRLPHLEALLDGRLYEQAAPMIDDRFIIGRGMDDVLARAVTLLLRSATRILAGDSTTEPFVPAKSCQSFAASYLTRALPRLVAELRRRRQFRYAHWRVGYRLHDGPGVADTGALGNGWAVLPDDGSRFYADPFPFEHQGARYIFVEDYPHATGKAVISVARLDHRGVAGTPTPVLEAPHHLSYPQVFAEAGEVWMLPEGSASGRLTLYRAASFPDHWEPAADLLAGTISDVTLLRRDDGWWMFATDRDGAGSTSDTLVVYHAPAPTGPWTPHRQNPILIDRRRARPGGAIIERDGRLFLPTQDGTLGYGGGLGLAEITRLDTEAIELAAPRPVSPAGDFPYPQIHTLNRSGRLEVIDGIAPVRKR